MTFYPSIIIIFHSTAKQSALHSQMITCTINHALMQRNPFRSGNWKPPSYPEPQNIQLCFNPLFSLDIKSMLLNLGMIFYFIVDFLLIFLVCLHWLSCLYGFGCFVGGFSSVCVPSFLLLLSSLLSSSSLQAVLGAKQSEIRGQQH